MKASKYEWINMRFMHYSMHIQYSSNTHECNTNLTSFAPSMQFNRSVMKFLEMLDLKP